jgi:GNAT superfamily N-acetyltransferase
MTTAQQTATAVIAEEHLDTCLQEALPLLEAHWREIASWDDIPLQPDYDRYVQAEARGQLCIVTARVEGRLVGYAVFFVATNGHYSGSLQAVQDILYVDRSRRGAMVGIRLVAAAERILAARGVQVVYHHVKRKHPLLGELLARKGYEAVETIYAKRLDREEQ